MEAGFQHAKLDGLVTVGGVRYPGLKESGAWDGMREPNCLHSMAPYVPGTARRWSATPDEDAGYRAGQPYALLQRQRANERKIRAAKEEAAALRAAGSDDSAARLRLGRAQRAQRRLMAENPKLQRRPERERAYGADGRPVSVRPLSKAPKPPEAAGGYERVSPEAKRKMQRRSDAVYASMTRAERRSMRLYTGDGDFKDINGPLFAGRMPEDPELAEAVRHMDSAIKKYQLSDDIIVYKGTNAKYFIGMSEGDEGEWGGYYSTAVSKGPTRPFMDRISRAGGKPLWLVIRVPSGTPGIYVGDNTDFKRPQDEFVLARGTRYRVISRADDEMVLEVVGHGTAH